MSSLLQLSWRLLVGFSLFLLVVPTFAEEPPSAQEKPKGKGDPVYLVMGRLVIFYEGIEKPEAGYRTSLGGAPALAVIKREGKIVGEVVAAKLPGSPADEAKSNAASPEKSEKIKLVEKKTIKEKNDREIETVTLLLNTKSNFGDSWIAHSVYFPAKEAAVTFKLLAGEKDFAELRPVFEKMMGIERVEPQAK